ncbi:uncharacterized protein M437DRAFT_70756 [Aureobasidium melanogenum CBS 110374]|uniref:Uncharacterized protein n=1 Tax=Aureobasidium melanogenum (strain CBS 110374) TaxID=1043003 RepID=A0A074VIR3_AURM1|nr:uncharacterized protein M437DRAFT_70756 [Aureobasidium melanogenum CBS 110374]KEQ57497.1 hypothetical protein M437DRAFT_70756 [Aureobasidium melanogenum CBS 110374]
MIMQSDWKDHRLQFCMDDIPQEEIGPPKKGKKRPGPFSSTSLTQGICQTPGKNSHIEDLVKSLNSFRSSMSHLGLMFVGYAMDHAFWFPTMCFEGWLRLNSDILTGSWVQPNEVRDALQDFLTHEGQNHVTMNIFTRSHENDVQDGASVLQLFEIAECERQRFGKAYKALQELNDRTRTGSPDPKVSPQEFCHQPLQCTPLYRPRSEPIHSLGNLQCIRTFLHQLIEAGKNDIEMMSDSKRRFDACFFKVSELAHQITRLESFRSMINAEDRGDKTYDTVISIQIGKLEQSRENEKCVGQTIISSLLSHTETTLEEFRELLMVDEHYGGELEFFLGL